VSRTTRVTVNSQDLDGKSQRSRKAGGLLGHAQQHEMDDLDGVLCTEHMGDLSTLQDLRNQSEKGEPEGVKPAR
jgi:peptide deformylase